LPEVFIGTIWIFGGNFAPSGWAFCNGQLLPINQNQALFAVIGTLYGGDGVNNFALPNLQSRMPIHFGQGQSLSPYNVGDIGGTENVTLGIGQMPLHTHTMAVNSSGAPGQDAVSNAFLGNGGGTSKPYATTSTPGSNLNLQAIAPTGGSQPHENLQPYIAMNYIIALNGIFPSRG
jgi:microcystin-dependent protein